MSRSVASLKMHPLHSIAANANYSFYTHKYFETKAIRLTLDELKNNVLLPLQKNSATFIQERSLSALKQARSNHALYEIRDANKIGAFESCVEALTDTQFRKGSSQLFDKKQIRNHIAVQAEKGVIDIALQMLPNKVNTPIKSRSGILPCLAEIGLLLRLSEICQIAQTAAEQNKKSLQFRFRAIMDGFRFQHALNIQGCDIIHYQNALHWWLDVLDVSDHVLLHDYEAEMAHRIPVEARIREKASYYHQAQNIIDSLLESSDLLSTLNALSANDPFGEYEQDEGKLQKLFKSILYTYHHQDFEKEFSDTDRYQDAYRNILNGVYSDQKATNEWTEVFVKRTFHAASNYMASVHADRKVLLDPVSAMFPDAIRMNLLPKKDQIGLNPLCTTRPDSMKPWHGVCLIRRSGDATKIDAVSRLYAEGIQAVPVILDPNDLSIRDTPLAPMQQAHQTFFYIEPDLARSMSIKDIFTACTRYTK